MGRNSIISSSEDLKSDRSSLHNSSRKKRKLRNEKDKQDSDGKYAIMDLTSTDSSSASSSGVQDHSTSCSSSRKLRNEKDKQDSDAVMDLTNTDSSSSGVQDHSTSSSSSRMETANRRNHNDNQRSGQLRELGFSIEKIAETVNDEMSLEKAVEALLAAQGSNHCDSSQQGSSSSSSNTSKVFCTVMQDFYPSRECLRINCKCSHRFSVEALVGHIRSNLLNDEQPVIPACPMANLGKTGDENRCDYAMSEQDVESILDAGLSRGLIESAIAQAVWTKAKELYLARAHRLNGHIRCISCPGLNNEGVWFELSTNSSRRRSSSSSSSSSLHNPRRGQRITCPVCGTEFCSNCNAAPYHFHCDCDALVGHLQAWMDWSKPGGQRDAYIAEDKALQKVIAENAKKREAEVAELRKTLETLQADEIYKEKHCRLCPVCGSIIERVSGCDHMMCGDGNQKGCGKAFNWRTAPKYKAAVSVPPSLEKATTAEGGVRLPCHHELCEGEPLLCDHCGEDIVGARLKCLHCPSFNMCLSCNLFVGHTDKHVCIVLVENEV